MKHFITLGPYIKALGYDDSNVNTPYALDTTGEIKVGGIADLFSLFQGDIDVATMSNDIDIEKMYINLDFG